MKVFISWSGSFSRNIAIILHDWLPMVIQSIDPYVSSEEIDKGARWIVNISKELEATNFGIICITEENVDAPWLSFEAGALSKSLQYSRVLPFLIGLKNSDFKGPLSQFQTSTFDKNDVNKLILSINK